MEAKQVVSMELFDKRFSYLYEDVEDIKQFLEREFLEVHEERIREFLRENGEMIQDDVYLKLPLKRKNNPGQMNHVSRWLFWLAFESLQKKRIIETHSHGRGKRRTYSLREDC